MDTFVSSYYCQNETNKADDDAVTWLKTMAATALAK